MDLDPLLYWIEKCSTLDGIKNIILCSYPEIVCSWNYKDLCNGILLNAVLIYIDQRSERVDPLVSTSVNDVSSRLRNLSTFLKNMLLFYNDVLHQIVVMPLPDLLTIARHPFPEGSGEEMKKVLLLLLGCAVQSDKKEEFVNKIKELEESVQNAIVEQIKKVINEVDFVLNVQTLELDPDNKATAVVLHQLQRVVKERDYYAQTVLELNQEQESDSSSTQSVCNGDVCSRKLPESQQHVQFSMECREGSIEKHHSAVEFAELKAKYRRTKQELDQVADTVLTYKEDVEEKEEIIKKLKEQNLDLLKDARSAALYRDENDVLQEKAEKLERLESECSKYKEKLAELDIIRTNEKELKEENIIIRERMRELDAQCESLRDQVQEKGNANLELLKSQQKMADLQQRSNEEQERIGSLVVENLRLEKECQESFNKAKILEKELDNLKTSNVFGVADGSSPNRSLLSSSLSDQLNESAHSKILKLELENQKLRRQLDSSPSSGVDDAVLEIVDEMKTENEKLKKKLDYLQDQNAKSSNLCLELQDERETFVRQRQDFERTFHSLEENAKRDIDEFKTENRKLQDELCVLKAKAIDAHQLDELKRCVDEAEMKLENVKLERDELKSRRVELCAENKTLAQEICRLKSELTRTQDRVMDNDRDKLEFENRAYVLDREKRCTEKDNARLSKMLDESETELEQFRARLMDMEREKQKLDAVQSKFEEAEKILIEMEVDKKHLTQQLDMEQKKMAALREDLVSEKTRTHEMETKIQSVLTCLDLPTTSDDQLKNVDSAVQSFVKKLKSDLEDYQSRYEQTNFDRNQLLEQLQGKDKDMESLKQKLLAQQTDRSKVLIKELEQKNLATADENKNVKQQVYILQEQIRKMQTIIDGAGREKSLLQQEIKDLQLQMSSNNAAQSDNAKLQVELRALQLQVTVLEQDNIELEKQCGQCERDHLALRRDFEQMQQQHGSLLADHEQLQNLHEQLSTDYEKLQCELNQLKNHMRQMRHDCLEHCEQLDRLSFEKKSFLELKLRWEQELQAKEREYKAFALLQNEHGALKKSYDELKSRYDFLTNDIDNVRGEYRNLRSDYNNVNLRATQLQGQLTDCQELIQRKDLEVVKLLHKCDMLTQLNGTLEEESRTLLRQMDMLIAQNQDLLTQALMDKEHYHAEEKELQVKLNALRRHKEKLEEKIMEQYKVMESPSKRKEKTNFIKKAKAALTPRPSTKKVKNASEENYMSGDEGGFASSNNSPVYHTSGYAKNGFGTPQRALSAERPNSLFNNEHLKTSQSTSLETLQNSGLNSPPVSHKRSHSSSTQPESNLSSNGSNVGAQQSETHHQRVTIPSPLTPGHVVIDRISLAGSERAVDVPTDKLSPSKCPLSPGAKLPPPYPPPRQTVKLVAPPPPPRAPPCQPRTVPPRYGAPPPTLSPPPLSRSASTSSHRPRPPPPPYCRGTAKPPMSPPNLRRPTTLAYSSSATAEVGGGVGVPLNSADYFAPQQTSTPRSEQSFVFNTPPSGVYHPGNNSSAATTQSSSDYESLAALRKTHTQRQQTGSGPSSQHYNNNNGIDCGGIIKRKDVLSYYENIENLTLPYNSNNNNNNNQCDAPAPPPTADNSSNSDVIPEYKNDNSVWFEYGCV